MAERPHEGRSGLLDATTAEPLEAALVERLERLRQSGLTVNREGHFIHEGELVTHEGLRAALYRWLDRLPPPDGRHVLRLDERRYVYVGVEDTPLVVRGAQLTDGGARVGLTLSDGSAVELEPATLRLRADGSLICCVRAGRLEARFSTAALAALQSVLGEDETGAFLELGAERARFRT